MKRLLPLILSLFAFEAVADTTVSKVSRENFPNDDDVRLYVHKGELYLECANEYSEYGRKAVDRFQIESDLKKALKWSEINKTARAKISKSVSETIIFHGTENGLSFIIVSVGKACAIYPSHIKELKDGLVSRYDWAVEEDSKDKASLFQ